MQLFQAHPLRLTPFIHPDLGQGYGTAMASQRLHVQHMFTFCSLFAFLLLSFSSSMSCVWMDLCRTVSCCASTSNKTSQLVSSLHHPCEVYACHLPPSPTPSLHVLPSPPPQMYFLSGSIRSKASMLFSYIVNTIAPLMTNLASRGRTPLQKVSTPSCLKIMPAHLKLFP